jgi:hypothetical protein
MQFMGAILDLSVAGWNLFLIFEWPLEHFAEVR